MKIMITVALSPSEARALALALESINWDPTTGLNHSELVETFSREIKQSMP